MRRPVPPIPPFLLGLPFELKRKIAKLAQRQDEAFWALEFHPVLCKDWEKINAVKNVWHGKSLWGLYAVNRAFRNVCAPLAFEKLNLAQMAKPYFHSHIAILYSDYFRTWVLRNSNDYGDTLQRLLTFAHLLPLVHLEIDSVSLKDLIRYEPPASLGSPAVCPSSQKLASHFTKLTLIDVPPSSIAAALPVFTDLRSLTIVTEEAETHDNLNFLEIDDFLPTISRMSSLKELAFIDRRAFEPRRFGIFHPPAVLSWCSSIVNVEVPDFGASESWLSSFPNLEQLSCARWGLNQTPIFDYQSKKEETADKKLTSFRQANPNISVHELPKPSHAKDFWGARYSAFDSFKVKASLAESERYLNQTFRHLNATQDIVQAKLVLQQLEGVRALSLIDGL